VNHERENEMNTVIDDKSDDRNVKLKLVNTTSTLMIKFIIIFKM